MGYFVLGLLLNLVTAGLALADGPSLHPTFPLLDADGGNVLETGNPVSTMQTCGGCHDTAFIAEHSFHTDVGLSQLTEPGQVPGGRPWDTSPGYFGKWNPLTYRYLTITGEDRPDVTLPDWVRLFGARHVGGGPAETAPTGESLLDLPKDTSAYLNTILDPETGQTIPWDWAESGTVEMNCFLCHIPDPNNQARIETLAAGNFQWANTATLLGTGIVTDTEGALAWNPAAFTPDGTLAQEYVTMQDPSNSNCGQCHGSVHTTNDTPLIQTGCDWNTATTGEIFAPQRLYKSGMNLQDKEDLSRTWDVHAERVVDCVDCHASLNNPVYFQGTKDDTIEHLVFDARRIDISEYLYQPLHQFAKGSAVQSTAAPEFNDTMRRCEGCHDPSAVHEWLPYKEAHFANVSCESCHVPKMYAPAVQQVDWTVVNADGEAQRVCRGVEGDPQDVDTLISGFNPILLPHQRTEGGDPLAPFNLVSAWYWVYGEPERPVRLIDLQAAYLDGDHYRADVLTAFDSDGSGSLDDAELRLDTPVKEALIQQNLTDLGLDNPRIKAEVQPYSINHGVTNGEWATKTCDTCHSQASRIAEPIQLAAYVPGDVMPQFFGDTAVAHAGEMVTGDDGSLHYRPNPAAEGLYIFGYSRVKWIDWLGVLAFFGTTLGVFAHAGLRAYSAAKHPQPHHPYERVYMYTVYERFWHWLQAAVIFLLIFTGLIIHKPDILGIFSFPYMVQIHNVLGFILLINAFLAVFYHLASGEIQQFIPRPHGFFDQMITQATFYLRGIFKGEAHPFEKTPQKKLNPLQQLTYFGLLNVLLPLQIITGVLIWGMQTWPQLAHSLGGLPVLAPIHSLIAWLLASFIIMHVYLTTTGHKPLGGIQAMMDGWDEVEVNGHSAATEQETN
ncbi:MAG: cytochrome b/b6 domain-containing protein [Anaerolineae bacterium]|nr:cytochrome b/b6 domain-containing protein [Anaerolineae bacterium]